MMSGEVMPIHLLRSAPATSKELARNNSAQREWIRCVTR